MALPEPRGVLIRNFLIARLQRIAIADGYFTDAGEGADDGPLKNANLPYQLTIQIDSEAPQAGASGENTGNPQVADNYTMQRPFTILGVIRASADDSKGLQVEYLLSDIKRAVFDGKPFDPAAARTLGWPTYTGATLIQRADGNEYEAVKATGTVTYIETIGDPAT